ncbi:glycosyltransferase [Filimonas effusa]|uniref:Glycosyltransferase n=1 Tax=Filimonas effusa TaxID=2508721 RepID=A0A4Q1D1I6_9BACT|nr:glycosyltransferase family 2 protein [Filimonas effusa]RXK80961.1 glycosyltransferase [Filimonas effusa]
MIFLIIACIITLSWIIVSLYLLINARTIQSIKQILPVEPRRAPSVDIIIAVRNEEADLANALQSLCRLSYPNYRILIVNDRSTDNTGNILTQFAAHDPRITVHTITTLPAGWLGKNHALYTGAGRSQADWILFTDADVIYHPETLSRAMNFVLTRGIDNVAVLPEITSRSGLFKAINASFRMILETKLRPWKARDKQSKASIGIGAFSLLRRSAYISTGTHERIRLRPDDDLKLAEQVKHGGYKQDVLYGEEMLSLEWYTSVKQFIDGLMKNMFSAFNYNLPWAMLNALAVLLVMVLPVPVLLLSGQWYYMIMAAAILGAQWMAFTFHPGLKARWWYALAIPYAGFIIAYIVARSAWLNTKYKGIYWRDSFYSLDELKK